MVTILYRPDSEHARQVEEFQRELVKNQVVTKLINVDSREGSTLASLHDIVQYPGVIITADVGRSIKSWSGKLPQISEVTYMAHQ